MSQAWNSNHPPATRSVGSHLMAIAIAVAIGAAVNLIIATAIATAGHAGPSPLGTVRNVTRDQRTFLVSESLAHGSSRYVVLNQAWGMPLPGIAPDMPAPHWLYLPERLQGPTTTTAYGWPWRTLKGTEIVQGSATQTHTIGYWNVNIGATQRRLPYLVVLPGFIAGTAMYGTAALCALIGLRQVIMRPSATRVPCRYCGYDLSATRPLTCPACGTPARM